MAVLLFIVLSAVAAGAVAYAVLQPRLAEEKKTASRLRQMKGASLDRSARNQLRDRAQEQARRRKTIQNSLKEIEVKQRERSRHSLRPSLKMRLDQSGTNWTLKQFHLASAGLFAFFFLVGLMMGQGLLLGLGLGISVGLGLPRLVLAHLRKRRLKKFIAEFPNAVDLIVRGVKSGLPLNDTLKMIAGETAEPVRSEFRKIVESQQLGMTTPEAVDRLYQSVPLAETNFFSIVIAIQAQAGGNLSEALGNLSKVLRERKKMRDKIQAMSMEAKTSAGIIGSLPFFVGGVMTMTSPDYVGLLVTTTTGHIILAVAGAWMMTGILVMKKMIAFDF